MPYNDRFELYGPTLSEALNGSLPSVDVLRLDFEGRLYDIQDLTPVLSEDQAVSPRVLKATELTDQWRARAAKYRDPNGNLLNPARDVLSMLFLDSIDYLAWDAVLWNSKLKRSRSYIPEIYNKQLEARGHIRDNIIDYETIFQGASSDLLFEGLEALMFDARCLLNDKSDLHELSSDYTLIKGMLLGLLAEHKVLKALQSGGFENARYASAFEDTSLKWDVVIPPIEKGIEGYRAVQVKSDIRPGLTRALVNIDKSNHINIIVPTKASQDPFSLTEEDAQLVAQTVMNAPTVEAPKMVAMLEGYAATI